MSEVPHMKTRTTVFVLTLLVGIPLFAQGAGTPDFMAMVSAIDSLSTVKETDFSSVTTIVSEDPVEGTVTRRVQMYHRDAEDLLTMVILEPEVQRGQAHLRQGDNLWSYDPQSRKFTHVSLGESYEGTTARNSDFYAFSFSKDYRIADHAEERLGKLDAWVLSMEALRDDVTYSYVRIWIDKASKLLLKVEDYSLSRRLMRTLYYTQYSRVQGHILPAHTVMIDNVTAGRRTTIDIPNVSFAKLPDYVFTQAYIEQLAR
jgi:outer membrane lipoprotein-sorting protein